MSPRFTLTELLRSDGFVESWRGLDGRGDEPVVVRRTVLTGDPVLDDRIGHRFRAEASAYSRRNLPGFPTILDFGIDGPAWSARPWIESREDDPERLLTEGADALAVLHAAGMSHLNLHPGNALRGNLGLELTDPGSARDWRRDGGFALPDRSPAPEQTTPTARRGPWSDVWRLASTVVAMGHRETEVLRRALQADPVHRYPDAGALRAALAGESKGRTVFALGALDEQLIRLNRFSYENRACPGCGGVLLEPKPLGKGQCPVCREGQIARRLLDARLCPACHGGILKIHASADPPASCPKCETGRLRSRKGKASCEDCTFELTKEGSKWSDGERAFTAEEWRSEGGRTPTVLLCDACDVQFDLLPDGRRRRIGGPADLPEILTEQESARLADFSPLGGDDACCPVCSAEYLWEKEATTLVSYFDDPFGFGAANVGRRLPRRFAERQAVGLGDPLVKTVCDICSLSMAAPKGGLVELRSTPHAVLKPFLGESRSLEDWHRFAQGLPPEAEEGAFARTVDIAMRRAYLGGELGFDFTTSVLWRGPAIRDGRRVTFIVTESGLELRRGIRRMRLPLESFWASRASGDRLVLLRTGSSHLELEVTPRELPVDLQSGRRTVKLSAKDLAARIGRELAREGSKPSVEGEPAPR
ncbi:MAG: hypothetical protein EOO77_01840 [Oxalobacteraceae bacterium]|nr:MAG: hypothetical protein EOO77_01840 [Oxalobacteraceae bacterium]